VAPLDATVELLTVLTCASRIRNGGIENHPDVPPGSEAVAVCLRKRRAQVVDKLAGSGELRGAAPAISLAEECLPAPVMDLGLQLGSDRTLAVERNVPEQIERVGEPLLGNFDSGYL